MIEPQELIPDCWDCARVYASYMENGIESTLFFSRMILCPTCGNKRCPKANNHTFACTNSNEPGQQGSAY